MTIRSSSLKQQPWIYVDNPEQVGQEVSPALIGKWLLFVDEEDVDAVWAKIASATLSGESTESAAHLRDSPLNGMIQRTSIPNAP